MNLRTRCALIGAAVVISTTGAAAQQPDSVARRTQRTLDSLAAALRETQARLDSVAAAAAATPAQTAPAPRASGAYMNTSFVALSDFGWSTEKHVRSILGGDHDPKVRGFSLPNGELSLDGTVDPYLKGFSNIVLKLDDQGETEIELEEMYLLTTSLPHNLQLKAGQFFTEFGRQNPQHPHAWGFSDQPLVMSRLLGGEGLRSQGARLSWLVPTKFYTEAMLTVANATGGTTYSFNSPESNEIHNGQPMEQDIGGIRDLLIAPRLATSFDPTSTQTLLLGVSAAFGPNSSGPTSNTKLYGADVYWKWKSARAMQGFPFVSFQSEVMARRYDAAARTAADDATVSLPAETLKDSGAYAQLMWGIKPLIVAGVRADYVTGNKASFTSDNRVDRYRFSPNLTWYPSEYSKLRLQYNYDHRQTLGNASSVWLQYEFLLGAHAAHKF